MFRRWLSSFLPNRAAQKFRALSHAQVFETIYKEKYWSRGGETDSVSGPGSSRGLTRSLQKELPLLFEKYKIGSLLDLPCGDLHWISEVPLGDVKYTGADIVAELIAANQEKYPRKNFLQLDLRTHELPAADLLLCRDCLVHFSFADARLAFENISRSRCEWLLLTTFPGQTANDDIVTGLWRPLNLQAAPFGLPEPESLIEEDVKDPSGKVPQKFLGLWKREAIAQRFNSL